MCSRAAPRRIEAVVSNFRLSDTILVATEPHIVHQTERARIPLERMLNMAGRTVGQGDVGMPKISSD